MKPLESAPLQRFLEAELSAGNCVVDGGALEWGKLRRLVILAGPFVSRAWEREAILIFREINDPHYWKAEVEDSSTGEVVACRF
ncbi:hypothetical protein [Haloferula sp. BvORR071]|uniref:hypothetical protein n=1 Tax=Haloferula sp. BvORR071 TaxID=1396141 RepID=UPI0005588FE4|nr:hypothetical protein [Haloferula sp. BvORR071]